MQRTTSRLLILCLAIVTGFQLTTAREVSDKGRKARGFSKITGVPVSTLVNANNLAMWVRNDGWSARRPSDGNSGVTFPRGTTTTIFADGLIWGGFVRDGQPVPLRVGGQTYSIGTVPGRIISPGVAEDPNATSNPSVHIFRVRRDWATADLRQDAAELLAKALGAVTDADIQQVRDQYEQDWTEWPWEKGAPYVDRDGDGRYTPPRDPLTNKVIYDPARDEPGIADGDQVVWFVINDLDVGATTALYGSPPIGLEVQVTLWAYARTDPLGNAIFKQVRMIYKGTAATPSDARIDSMYFAQWSDPDLGDFGDDFVGCDIPLSLGYVYNSSAVDNAYVQFGLPPPSAGYDFLQGPIVPGSPDDVAIFGLKKRKGFRNLPMTAFVFFSASGGISDPDFDYSGTLGWYNLLRGFKPLPADVENPVPFFDPAGNPTTFTFSGDPVTGTGWLDSGPADRRLVLASGPFTMALGDTQEVVVAHLAGLGGDYLSSISELKANDIAVQNAYNDVFDLPKAPSNPAFRAVALDREIVLDWGSDLQKVNDTETFDRKGYTFEGYNVHQLPSASARLSQGIRLATFDLANGVLTVVDTVFDTGLKKDVIKVLQLGTDSGIKRFLQVTTDKIRQKPLVNGQQYYFALTTYGYNPSATALTHALESPPVILTVVPQEPNPGDRYEGDAGAKVQVTHSAGGSDGLVDVTVVDPTSTTGKAYAVAFQNVQTTFVYGPDSQGAFDTVTVPILNWSISADGQTLLSGVNQGPTVAIEPGSHNLAEEFAGKNGNEFDYPILDGLFITVAGPPPQLNADRSGYVSGTNWTSAGGSGRFVASTSVLRGQVTTAFDIPILYLGQTGPGVDPSQYKDIEFRFGDQGSLTQKAYRMSRAVSPIEQTSAYKFLDYSDVPFQVFDVSDPASPRQLNVGYRDQDLSGQWEPNGNVEVIFVASSTYDGDSPTTFTYGTTVGSSANNIPRGDYMYVAEWISADGTVATMSASVIRVSPNYVNSAADQFAFTAPRVTRGDTELAKQEVERVNVFPNPYYGLNRAETSRFQRFVTFNHLPQRATIRIFNLAGILVRTIEKSDPSQFTNWDLNNHNGLPVASGIYIAHIDLPDLGVERTLKVVIIQEQQILEFF